MQDILKADLSVVPTAPAVKATMENPINIAIPDFVKVAALVGFTSFLTYCATEMNAIVANKTKK